MTKFGLMKFNGEESVSQILVASFPIMSHEGIYISASLQYEI